MSRLTEYLSGGKNPAEAAAPYLDQIPGIANQYYSPYTQQGQQAYNTLQPQFSNMSTDPAAFLEHIMQNYEPSRGYQLKRDEGLRTASNTAAAGGMRGSMQDIGNESRLDDYLMSDDMQQWLQNVLGIQGAGMQGEQGFYNTGYDATKNLESDLANAMAQKANLEFYGQKDRNQSNNDLFSGIAKGIGAIAAAPLTGGASLGGLAIEHGAKQLGWM